MYPDTSCVCEYFIYAYSDGKIRGEAYSKIIDKTDNNEMAKYNNYLLLNEINTLCNALNELVPYRIKINTDNRDKLKNMLEVFSTLEMAKRL